MAEDTPLLQSNMAELPLATFTYAIEFEKKRRPQAIAHRGYKAAFPENTLGAFRGAVEVGAHAIETDVHITRDGVVVLSHDATLKRCFGQEDKILDCDWEYIKTLKTVREPHQQMPRLKDLLEYLATPGLEDIWVLLDVKLDNAADDIFRLISKTLSEVTPAPTKPWNQRVLLGCWAADQLIYAIKYLPNYPITHIGWNTAYARQFLKVPGVSFNMLQKILVGPLGSKFIRDVKAAGRSLFLWTVNDEEWMRWSIRKGVDGVITDDPKKYLEVCSKYNGERPRLLWKQWGSVVFYNTLAFAFTLIFRFKYGFNIDPDKVRRILEEARAQ